MNDRFKDPHHKKWAKAIKERDGFACQVCETQVGYLHSHHLNSYDIFISQRYELNNGLTLCKHCHFLFHSIYGSGGNTFFQFNEFTKMLKLIKNIALKLNDS